MQYRDESLYHNQQCYMMESTKKHSCIIIHRYLRTDLFALRFVGCFIAVSVARLGISTCIVCDIGRKCIKSLEPKPIILYDTVGVHPSLWQERPDALFVVVVIVDLNVMVGQTRARTIERMPQQ